MFMICGTVGYDTDVRMWHAWSNTIMFVKMYEFVLVNRYLAVIVLTAKIVTIRASDMHKFTFLETDTDN